MNNKQETALHLVSAFFTRGQFVDTLLTTVLYGRDFVLLGPMERFFLLQISQHHISIFITGPSAKVAQELLQGGANLNARNIWGDTAAHYAARHGPVCVLR